MKLKSAFILVIFACLVSFLISPFIGSNVMAAPTASVDTMGDEPGGNDLYDNDGTVYVTLSHSNDAVEAEISWDGTSSSSPGSWQSIPVSATSANHYYSSDGKKYCHYRVKDSSNVWSNVDYNYITVDTTPPPTPSPDDGVSGWSRDNTPTFSWSKPNDLSGIDGYSYVVDAQPDNSIDTYSTSVTLSQQSDGTHTFYVKAKDNAGNWGSAGSHTFSIDTTPPPVPKGLTVTAVPEGEALDLRWNAVSASEDFIYIIYRNGSYIKGLEDKTTYRDEGLTNGISYTYTITTMDELGNESAHSFPVSGVPKDTVPPVAPSSLEVSDRCLGNTINMWWSWFIGDKNDITFRLYMDSKFLVEGWGIGAYKTAIIISYLTDSRITDNVLHQFYLTAVDPSRNESSPSNKVSVATTDQTAPEIPKYVSAEVDSQNKKRIKASWHYIYWEDYQNDVVYYKIYRRAESKDPFSIDEEDYIGRTQGRETYFYDDFSNQAVDDTFYYAVKAVDEAGNMSDFSWPEDPAEMDTILPTSNVNSLPQYVNKIELHWGPTNETSDIVTYTIQVYDEESPGWVSFLTNTTLTSETYIGQDGHTYRFRSIATDDFGNVERDYTDSGDAWTTLDLSPPVVTIDSPEEGYPYNTFTILISGNITDRLSGVDINSLQILIYDMAETELWKTLNYNPSDSDWYYNSANGVVKYDVEGLFSHDDRYMIQIKVKDNVGNQGSSIERRFIVDTRPPDIGNISPNRIETLFFPCRNIIPDDPNHLVVKSHVVDNGFAGGGGTITYDPKYYIASGLNEASAKVFFLKNNEEIFYQKANISLNEMSFDTAYLSDKNREKILDGFYTIQLYIEDKAGNSATRKTEVFIDNVVPEIRKLDFLSVTKTGKTAPEAVIQIIEHPVPDYPYPYFSKPMVSVEVSGRDHVASGERALNKKMFTRQGFMVESEKVEPISMNVYWYDKDGEYDIFLKTWDAACNMAEKTRTVEKLGSLVSDRIKAMGVKFGMDVLGVVFVPESTIKIAKKIVTKGYTVYIEGKGVVRYWQDMDTEQKVEEILEIGLKITIDFAGKKYISIPNLIVDGGQLIILQSAQALHDYSVLREEIKNSLYQQIPGINEENCKIEVYIENSTLKSTDFPADFPEKSKQGPLQAFAQSNSVLDLDPPSITFVSAIPEKGPETNVPIVYRLSESAYVNLFIYDEKGVLVRRLDITEWREGGEDIITRDCWDGKDDSRKFVPDGNYVVVIAAQDNAGNISEFATGTIQGLDNPPFIDYCYTVPYRFLPNESTKIEFELSENADINIEISDIHGEVVKTIQQSSMQGHNSVVWDGIDNNGNPAAAGKYNIEVFAKDLIDIDKNPIKNFTTTIKDFIPPEIFVPEEGDFYGGTLKPNLDIVGIAVEAAQRDDPDTPDVDESDKFKYYEAFYAFDDENPETPLEWQPVPVANPSYDVYTSTTEVGYGLLATLDTIGLESGKYLLKVEVTNDKDVARVSELRSAYIDNTPPEVTDFTTEPFSPNKDFIRDLSNIHYTLSDNSPFDITTSVKIEDPHGKELITLVDEESRSQGAHSLVWNGKDKDGNLVTEEGVYKCKIKATDGLCNTALVGSDVIVDFTAPLVSNGLIKITPGEQGEHSNPDIFAISDSSIDVYFDVRDNLTSSGRATITFSFDTTVVTKEMSFSLGQDKQERVSYSWDGKNAQGDYVPDGIYTVTIVATDEAGNKGEEVNLGSLEVDRTSPEFITLYVDKFVFSPENGEDIDLIYELSERAQVDIVIENGFGDEILRDSLGWREEGVSYTYTWDGRIDGDFVSDGSYIFCIKAFDKVENEGSRAISIIKNYPPATIRWPEKLETGYTIVEGTITVIGTALDPGIDNPEDFSWYKVWYREGKDIDFGLPENNPLNPDTNIWNPVPVPSSYQNTADPAYPFSNISYRAVVNTTLAIWDTSSLASGNYYTLLLVSKDEGGNFSSDWCTVQINPTADSTCPIIEITKPIQAFQFEIISKTSKLDIEYSLSNRPANVILEIFKMSDDGQTYGSIVYHQEYLNRTEGDSIEWDGKNSLRQYVEDGRYRIRLTARDTDGIGVTQDEVDIILKISIGKPLKIVTFKCSDSVVKPNESVTITFEVSKEALVNIGIYDGGDNLIENLVSEVVSGETEKTTSWSTGVKGLYVCKINATATDSEGTTDSASFPIAVTDGTGGEGIAEITYPEEGAIVQGKANFNWEASGKGEYYPPQRFTVGVEVSGEEEIAVYNYHMWTQTSQDDFEAGIYDSDKINITSGEIKLKDHSWTETTTADFDAGVIKDNINTANNELKLLNYIDDPTNLSLGKAVETCQNGFTDCYKINDNDLKTYAYDCLQFQSNKHWITVNLGKTYWIREIRFKGGNGSVWGAFSGKLQYYDGSWHDISGTSIRYGAYADIRDKTYNVDFKASQIRWYVWDAFIEDETSVQPHPPWPHAYELYVYGRKWTTGHFCSREKDLGTNCVFGKFYESHLSGQNYVFKIRRHSAGGWSNWVTVTNGNKINLTPGDKVQYDIVLTSNDGLTNPKVYDITVQAKTSNATYTSLLKDLLVTPECWGRFEANYTLNNGNIDFYIASSSYTVGGSLPSGTIWYPVSDGQIPSCPVKRYIQWKAHLYTDDGLTTPTLYEVKINYTTKTLERKNFSFSKILDDDSYVCWCNHPKYIPDTPGDLSILFPELNDKEITRGPFYSISNPGTNDLVTKVITTENGTYQVKATTNEWKPWDTTMDQGLVNGKIISINNEFNNSPNPVKDFIVESPPIILSSAYPKVNMEVDEEIKNRYTFWKDEANRIVENPYIKAEPEGWKIQILYPNQTPNNVLQENRDLNKPSNMNDITIDDDFTVKLIPDTCPQVFIVVRGNTSTEGFKGYLMFYRKASESIWEPIPVASDSPVTNSGVLAYWDVTGLNGEYVIKLVGDSNGTYEATRNVTIGTLVPGAEHTSSPPNYVTAPFNKAWLEFDPDALEEDTYVTITPVKLGDTDILLDPYMPQPIGPIFKLQPKDIAFTKNAQGNVDPGASITVRFLEEELVGINRGHLTAYHVKDDGTLESINITTGYDSNGYFTITCPVKSFSYYVIIPEVSPPQLDPISSPTNQKTIDVTGQAEPSSTVEVFINGASVGTTDADKDGRFSLSVELVLGNNSISATSSRWFNNISRTSGRSTPVNVVLDLNPPEITKVSDWPDPFTPDGDQIRDTTKISYTISERAKVTISIYGQEKLVRTLESEGFESYGDNSNIWDGEDELGELVPEGLYTYKIIAIDEAGNTSQEVTGEVKVSFQRLPPPSPLLIAPANNTYVLTSTPVFEISPDETVERVLSYKIEISTDHFNTIFRTFDQTESEKGWEVDIDNAQYKIQPEDALDDAHYNWRACCYDDYQWSDPSVSYFFTLDATKPPKIFLFEPRHEIVIGNPEPTFRWIDVEDNLSGLDYYEIQVDNNDDFGSLEFTTLTSSSTAVPTDNLAIAVYYWRVRAKDKAGNYGDWSTVWRFDKVDAPPQAPELMKPANNCYVTTLSPSFELKSIDLDQDILKYKIELSSNNFASLGWVFDQTVSSISWVVNEENLAQYTVQEDDDLSDGFYHWKASAYDGILWGNVSSTFTFVLDTIPPEVEINSPASGKLYVANQDTLEIDFNVTDLDSNPLINAYLLDQEEGTTIDVTNGQIINLLNIDDGYWDFILEVTDWAGHSSTATATNFEVTHDIQPPRTSIDIGEPKYGEDPIYVKSITPFVLEATDDYLEIGDKKGRGITQTEYRIDDEEWVIYQGTFTISLNDGVHYIYYRSKDKVNNEEGLHSLKIYMDNTSPCTKLIPSGELYNDGKKDFAPLSYTYSLTIQGSSSDVKYIKVSIDSGDWVSYDEPISFSTEGEHSIRYRAVDRLDNMEEEREFRVVVDGSPPESGLEISEPKYQVQNGEKIYVTSQTLFSIKSDDKGLIPSDIGRKEYRINQGAWQSVSDNFYIEGEDREYLIEYRGIDNVQNIESTKTESIFLDNTPPSTTIVFGDPCYMEGDSIWVSSETTISLESDDGSGCGVKTIEYAIQQGEKKNYTEPIQFSEEGTYQLTCQSSDNLGNIGGEKVLIFNVDNTPPITTLKPNRTLYNDGQNSYASFADSFELISQDEGCGVCSVLVNVDGTGWVLYSFPITFSTQGEHTIEYKSVDNLGHWKEEKPFKVIIDGSPPGVISLNPSNNAYIRAPDIKVVEIRFNEDVTYEGDNWEQGVLISKASTGEQVKGKFSPYDKESCTLKFTSDWEDHTEYKIEVNGHIIDRVGNPLKEFSSSFTTLMLKEKGGKVEEGEVSLEIPPDGLPEDAVIIINKEQDEIVNKIPRPYQSLEKDKLYHIIAYNQDHQEIQQKLNKPMGIKISYGKESKSQTKDTSEGERNSVDPKTLKLYWYNPEKQRWELVENSKNDFSVKEVIAQVERFGRYCLMGFIPFGDSLEGLSNYPNPFPAFGKDYTTIQYYLKDDADVAIAIYDLVGNLVKVFEKKKGEEGGRGGDLNRVEWDGRNGRGDKVANGGYICRVQIDDGKRVKSKTRKILVIK